jgi:hypothetical protein
MFMFYVKIQITPLGIEIKIGMNHKAIDGLLCILI